MKGYVLLAISMGALVLLKAGSGCNYAGPTIECYDVEDGGSSPICAFGSGDEPVDGGCIAGYQSGTCPLTVSKSHLAGCCTETETASGNQEPTVTFTKGTCYYSASVAKIQKAKCV